MKAAFLVLAACATTEGLVVAGLHRRVHTTCRNRVASPVARQEDGRFDLSAQQFDFLSLRTFRRDALLQYDATNQSEPLRIALTFLGVLFFLTLPSLVGELGFQSTTPFGMDPLAQKGDVVDPLLTNGASLLGSGGCGLLFLRNRGARLKRIARIDREYALGDLRATYRGVRTNFLRELRGKRRVVALVGSRESLDAAVSEAFVYRRRLAAANVAVVPVYPSADGGLNAPESSPPWLWAAAEPAQWRSYFADAMSARGMEEVASGGAWLALNLKGRSVGSALGQPRWDELLGTALQPTDAFGAFSPAEADATDLSAASAEAAAAATSLVALAGGAADAAAAAAGAAELLAAQERFYAALTGGDLAAMQALWEGAVPDASVSEVLAAGGALDPWASQLREGMRPAGMRASDCDALLVSEDEGWTTTVERPSEGGTLLATQRWSRGKDGAWRLAAHRTIPWSAEGGTAVATLRCDGRGCVALGREIDTRA